MLSLVIGSGVKSLGQNSYPYVTVIGVDTVEVFSSEQSSWMYKIYESYQLAEMEIDGMYIESAKKNSIIDSLFVIGERCDEIITDQNKDYSKLHNDFFRYKINSDRSLVLIKEERDTWENLYKQKERKSFFNKIWNFGYGFFRVKNIVYFSAGAYSGYWVGSRF